VVGDLWEERRWGVTGDVEMAERALRIAKFDKLLVAVFNVIAAVIPFTALSLFLGLMFGGISVARLPFETPYGKELNFYLWYFFLC
jgi:hypothetical protein